MRFEYLNEEKYVEVSKDVYVKVGEIQRRENSMIFVNIYYGDDKELSNNIHNFTKIIELDNDYWEMDVCEYISENIIYQNPEYFI